MSYVALYRKFRPQTFDDVRGQDAVVTTLRNQVMTGRLQHAYLFCGTRGTGKTSIAKILARAVNCEHPDHGNPCGECASCRAIRDGTAMNVIEIDAASNNGVDNVREIVEEVRYRPTSGNYKVYIIDEVHMLSTGAFNALLKTLEEPPSYVIFILATTEAGKIPTTILSRCQRYDFRRIGADTLTARMRELLRAEQMSAEDKALTFIARQADGSMRDALSLLDRCLAMQSGETLLYETALSALGAVDTEVFRELLGFLLRGNAGGAISLLGQMLDSGREIGQLVADFIWYLRNLLLLLTSENAGDLVDASEQEIAALSALRGRVRPETVMRYIRVLSDLQGNLRYATSRRTLTEVALVRICRPQMEKGGDALRERIAALEGAMDTLMDSLEGGYVPSSAQVNVRPQAAVKDDKPKAPPSKAAPEDLRLFIERWETIRERAASLSPKSGGGMVAGYAKAVLARLVPSYNGQTGENVVYLRETSEEPVNLDAKQQEVIVLAVSAAAGEVLEKTVEVRLALAGTEHPELSELSIHAETKLRQEEGSFNFDNIEVEAE